MNDEGTAGDKGGGGVWTNLMPAPNLAGFRRVPIDPLADKVVWQVRGDGTLLIDGAGAKEMLLQDTAFGDGVLHVEWRFLEVTSDKPIYNGGVYVRTQIDGKTWVQLQVAHADKPPVVGDLIAQVPGQTERINRFQTGPSPAAALGQWNTYEVTARGKNIELVVNGQPTVTWSDCPMPTGHVGLQAEGSPIEVRALKWKPL
ncbi:MAG TPA: DUF1080 domain-containing protein [Opitutaceae bacterium]|nr:DUF1080 domain-containing protein [Opitutaceae bacterium]